MSKSQTLRALVNERLTAAAEEIFALFERTIAEYEEEVCRSKEETLRKQELLDSILNPRVVLPRAAVQVPSKSPGPGLDQDPPQTPRIKEEPEEPSVKREEHTLLVQVAVPESSAVCVMTEESSLLQQRQTELRKETQGKDISAEPHLCSETEGDTELSSDTDNDDDWGAPSSCSALQMETDTDGDQYNQVQKGQTLRALVNEQLTVTAEETHLYQDTSQTARIKEDPEEPSVKQEEHTLLVQVGVPESSAVCVMTEESSLRQQRQTELREETQGEDISTEPHLHFFDTDSDDDWGALFNFSAAQMETDADGDHHNQVQKGQRLRALNEQLTVTETHLYQDTPQTSWNKEEPEEPSVKQEEEQMSYNTNEASNITDFVPDTVSSVGRSYSEELEISDDKWQELKRISITNVTSCNMETFTDFTEPDYSFHNTRAENSMNISSYQSTVTSFSGMATYVPPVPEAPKRTKYKKRQYCLFCQKPFYKLARHLGSVHRDEQDVALAFSLTTGSKKRREMLRSLKNRGNFSHNATVASSGFGELVACRRPGELKPPSDFVHCTICQGLFARKTLWRHVKHNHKALFQAESKGRRRRICSYIHLPTPTLNPQDEMDLGENDCGEGVNTDDPNSQSSTALPEDTSESSPEHSIPKKVVKRRRRPWTLDEIKAVEQHMMDFITHRKVPGKRSCDSCLQSEPHALKDRHWVDIKNFVHNQISASKRKLKRNGTKQN